MKKFSRLFAVLTLLFIVSGAVLAQGKPLFAAPLEVVDKIFKNGFEDFCSLEYCPRPEFPPYCILSGTIHSDEGQDFHEIKTIIWGYDGTSSALYPGQPLYYFSPEPGVYHQLSEPELETEWVPLLCGNHDLTFHSMDSNGCYTSPDEICFRQFSWWGQAGYDGSRHEIATPLETGLEIPVAHISGTVKDSDGLPVEGIELSAIYNQALFSNAANNTISGASGFYDMVVLPNQTWTLTASIPDNHPRINELWVPVAVEPDVAETDLEINLTMPAGPERCPLSGSLTTSDGIALERVSFHHYSPWYGDIGWQFRSDAPGIYYRHGNEAITLNSIPLVCGVQDLILYSRHSSTHLSCNDWERFDQPCFEGFRLWQSFDLSTPHHGFEFAVVTLSGRITLDGDTPIEGAKIVASGTVYTDGPVLVGGVSNYALSGADGSYRLALLPGDLFSYDISITTPPWVDLGSAIINATINEDTVIDANFSSIDVNFSSN